LLLDTLKKAEESKRQTVGKDGGAIASTPSAAASIAEAGLLPLAASSASLAAALARQSGDDAGLAAVIPLAPSPRRSVPEESQLEEPAARAAFAAKRSAETGRFFWPIAVAGIMAIVGVAGYYGWQLRAIESAAVLFPATPAAAVPTALPPPVRKNVIARPVTEAAPPRQPVGKPVTPARVPAAPSVPPNPERVPGTTAAAVGPPRQEAADAIDNMPRLTRTQPRANVPLERAYEALQSGRNEEAQRAYEQVLRGDEKNTDALLGLATIAARQGQSDWAHAYYLRALETDPTDATARAGVLSTSQQDDADTAARHLEAALVRQPDSPPLLFALGSVYANEQRWSEAQHAYFLAYTGDSDNPDIIFNLAVSLDHLRQDKLAARYYRMALDAGDTRAAAFSRDRVKARLLELQP
jgi:tetratricopeptide (TPR) repeat protein